MKKRIFSGVQPSGNLHIGNYLGAIKNWVKLQDEYDSVFCVVDLHAITTPQNPEELRKKTIEVAKTYLAAGINPEKCAIFIQSHIPEHTELTWILNTLTKVGDLTKMTQLKDKAEFKDWKRLEEAVKKFSEIPSRVTKKISEIPSEAAAQISKIVTTETIMKTLKEVYIEPLNKASAGVFNYPILMASDILLYNTDVVPVGEDQVQHIELARTLARRFNQKFGETFKVPEASIVKEGQRIMGLDDPTKKMSKSAASEYNYILLTDDTDTVRRKIQKAVTDSGSEIKYANNKPALKNLINIYSLLDNKKSEEIVRMYQGKGPASTRGNATSTRLDSARLARGGYANFKNNLVEVIINFLDPFQKKFNSLSDEEVLDILKKGAEKVRPMAQAKMKEVKEKIGLI